MLVSIHNFFTNASKYDNLIRGQVLRVVVGGAGGEDEQISLDCGIWLHNYQALKIKLHMPPVFEFFGTRTYWFSGDIALPGWEWIH